MPAQPDDYSLDALSGAVDVGPEPVVLSEAIAAWLESLKTPERQSEPGE